MNTFTHKATLTPLGFFAAITLFPLLGHAQLSPPERPATKIPNQLQPPGDRFPASRAVEGTVRQYLMNPHGEVDGLLLTDGTQVNFPPHMANELVDAIKPEDPVSVQGDPGRAGAPVQGYLLTNSRTGRSVVEHEPSLRDRLIPPHIARWSMSEMRASGTIRTLLYARHGELHGVVLEDGTQVRMPPHLVLPLLSSMVIGRVISAEGYGTENQYGRVIEASVIGAGESMSEAVSSDVGHATKAR